MSEDWRGRDYYRLHHVLACDLEVMSVLPARHVLPVLHVLYRQCTATHLEVAQYDAVGVALHCADRVCVHIMLRGPSFDVCHTLVAMNLQPLPQPALEQHWH